MSYLFVLDDSLTSKRFTTRTSQLTKCCESLQKMGVRLGPCKSSLSSQVFLFTDHSKAILLMCFYIFMFWGRMFVLFEIHVRFHSFN